ncbi:hypothetical protein HN51_057511 [Arachis hypogaea]|uniref:uncharacterized protein n=1 Tax=Arachis hypogaea TaxID=3818 RepID=UPI0007AF6F9A|nr:probable myosin-binding protein 6 [Arachis ipaensis]XP_025680889.1 probable myosin-binding protein 6 [Arachis hypogaea]QHN80630.1 Myosin-binding protein [Arachis hypogaea]
MQMQTCFLVAVQSVLGFYHRFLRITLALMDFPSTIRFIAQASEVSCGFILLGYVSRIFNILGLILILFFTLKIYRISHPNSKALKHFPPYYPPPRSPPAPAPAPAPKIHHAVDADIPKPSSRKKSQMEDTLDDKEDHVEDEVFDVMALRNLVKFERQRFSAACAEIENERIAAASAAEEAMAMILRLQNEKSAIEIQANQFRRMMDQKQDYDNEVIDNLRWSIVHHENQKSLLEEQLAIYREKLRQFLTDDEIDLLDGSDNPRGGFLDFAIEYDVDNADVDDPGSGPDNVYSENDDDHSRNAYSENNDNDEDHARNAFSEYDDNDDDDAGNASSENDVDAGNVSSENDLDAGNASSEADNDDDRHHA